MVASSTANSIPYYAANGSILSATSSITILQNGYVGVGTTTPYAMFSINGKAGGTDDIFVIATSTSSYATSTALRVGANGNLYLPGGNGINVGYGTTAPPANGMIIAGSVGIGTTSPYSLLSVAGQVVGQNFVSNSITATSTFAGPLSIMGAISTPNPIDVYDDFSGSTQVPLPGRLPKIGQYAWSTSGTGYQETYVGGGILGTGPDNTYFIIQTSQTPFEVYASFMSTSSTPFGVISVVKGEPTHGFSVMWHTTFGTGGVGSLYWNDTWNGAASTVSGVAPAYSFSSGSCANLSQNVTYVEHLVLNPPYSDADIETPTGTVLCSNRSYDPLLPTLIGPYVYIQSGSPNNTVYTSFTVNDRPSATNLNYGRFASGIDGTPIGTLAPAPGKFSSLVVGSTTPVGVFTVGWDGTPAAAPAFNSMGTGALTIASLVSGYGTTLTLQNGAGGKGTITMDGSYALSLAGNSGTTFLTKPANSGVPYFASALGIGTSAAKSALDVNGGVSVGAYAGASAAPSNGLIVSGNVGIGTSTPYALLSLAGSAGGTVPLFTISTSTSGFATSTALIVDKNGLVGIATTTPWRTFSVEGTVALHGLTSDTADSKTLCLTAAGEVVANAGTSCITSSERFKNTIVPLDATSGLAEVLQLNPVSFQYNSNIGIPGTQVGFIAEQVQQIDPRLVVLDDSNLPFTVRYENLTAILAKAIQEVATITGTFHDNLVAWFADAGNGIGDFFANRVIGNQLCAKNSDGTLTCVTGDQLRAALGGNFSSSAAAPAPVPATTTDDTTSTQTTVATSSDTIVTSDSSTTTDPALDTTVTPPTDSTPDTTTTDPTAPPQPDATSTTE